MLNETGKIDNVTLKVMKAREETLRLINDLRGHQEMKPETLDYLYHRLFTIVWRLL